MKLIRLLAKIVIVLAVVLLLAYFVVPQIAGRIFPLEHEEILLRYCEQYEIEPALAAGVIRAESSFRADAKSKAGAMGLMQLTPATFDWLRGKTGEDRDLTEEALYDPETNIKYGVFNLRVLTDRYEDETARLAAYNAGPARVDKWLSDPAYSDDGVHLRDIPYPETKNYVEKIEKYRAIYQYLYFGN